MFLQTLISKWLGVVIAFSSVIFYLNDTMELLNSVVMIISAFILFGALDTAGNYSALLRSVDLSVNKAKSVLEMPTMNLDGKNITPKNYDIDVENIEFSYDRRKIINGISVHIPEKTTTAIVGHSGGGKTTLCHLISRFWDVDKSSVKLGGEKQRISIARAIMKDAPVIILDEATANIDPESEQELITAIEALTREKTILMIAYRLKTVRHADKILVIDNGKIVQSRIHEQLMQEEGIYQRFVESRELAVGWKV